MDHQDPNGNSRWEVGEALSKMMQTTLITGGAGFIGSHLAEHLLKCGDRLLILDDLTTGSLDNLRSVQNHPRLEIKVSSVLDIPTLQDLVTRADRVFHLAASVGVKLIVHDPIKVIHSNVAGTEAVLEVCSRNRCPVLVASTSEVYGKSTALPFVEGSDLVLGPTTHSRWSYACSKAIGEFLCYAYNREKDLPLVIVRIFNTAGPRQSGQYGMVIPRFVDQAIAGKSITVYGDGSQSRCFSHVQDIVKALVMLIQTPAAYGETVNLGSREKTTIQGLAKRIKDVTGSTSTIVHIPFEKAYDHGFEDMQAREPDISKAKKLIGFVPKKTLDEILRDTIDERRSSDLPKTPT